MASLARVASSSVPLRARAFTAAAGEAMERLPRFNTPQELLEFSSNNIETLDQAQLSLLIRSVPFQMRKVQFEEAQSIRRSEDFYKMFNHALKTAQTNEDAYGSLRLFKELANTNNGFTPPSLKDAVQKFMTSVVSRRVELPVTALPDFLNLLIRVDVKDLSLCAFVKEELPKAVSALSPVQCRIALKSICELNMREADLIRPLMMKMEESLDQFKNADVMSSLSLFAETGLQGGRTLGRCVELLTQHASLFEAEELVGAGISLARIRQFNGSVASAMIEEIQHKKRTMRANTQLDCLQLLTHSRRQEMEFANELIGNLASSTETKTAYAMARMAHSICFFNLAERKALLQRLMQDLMALERRAPVLVELMNETLESCRLDMDLKITPSESYKLELENFLATPTKAPVSLIINQMVNLPKSHQFNFETKVAVGPFKPTFVDESAKVVFDVEMSGPPRVSGSNLRRRVYEKLGYSYARMPFSLFRRQPEATKWEAIRDALDGVAIKLGRVTDEEVKAVREASFATRRDARAAMAGSR